MVPGGWVRGVVGVSYPVGMLGVMAENASGKYFREGLGLVQLFEMFP